MLEVPIIVTWGFVECVGCLGLTSCNSALSYLLLCIFKPIISLSLSCSFTDNYDEPHSKLSISVDFWFNSAARLSILELNLFNWPFWVSFCCFKIEHLDSKFDFMISFSRVIVCVVFCSLVFKFCVVLFNIYPFVC